MATTYTDGEVLAIEYYVSIKGAELDLYRKQCITGIEIKETDDGGDTATINISDPEKIFIEDDIFVEEADIHIELGWSNTTYRVTFDGYISNIDIDFASDGIPKITLTCLDQTHDANGEKKDATFENTTSAEVVKQICQNYGWTCVVEDGYDFPVQETVTQSDQTDIEFMQNLASNEVYPFTARLEGNTFYYVKKGKLEDASISLTYGEYPHEIISFNPSINKESKEDKIESATLESSSKDVDTSEATSGNEATTEEEEANINTNKFSFNPTTKTWTKNKENNSWS